MKHANYKFIMDMLELEEIEGLSIDQYDYGQPCGCLCTHSCTKLSLITVDMS